MFKNETFYRLVIFKGTGAELVEKVVTLRLVGLGSLRQTLVSLNGTLG